MSTNSNTRRAERVAEIVAWALDPATLVGLEPGADVSRCAALCWIRQHGTDAQIQAAANAWTQRDEDFLTALGITYLLGRIECAISAEDDGEVA